jgi:hypothetical protein
MGETGRPDSSRAAKAAIGVDPGRPKQFVNPLPRMACIVIVVKGNGGAVDDEEGICDRE